MSFFEDPSGHEGSSWTGRLILGLNFAVFFGLRYYISEVRHGDQKTAAWVGILGSLGGSIVTDLLHRKLNGYALGDISVSRVRGMPVWAVASLMAAVFGCAMLVLKRSTNPH